MNLRALAPRRLARAGLAAVVGAVVLSGCSVYDIPLPGGADVGSNPTTLHIMFRDVLDLVPQSTVKVDDVTVGRVSDIKLKGYIADVTVKVPSDMKIPSNERVTIDQTSLLGEKFINLKRPAKPSSTLLGDGDTIPLAQTGRNPEVEEVLSALSALLNGGGVGQLKTIAHELNTAVGGREDEVREVIDQIHTFMGTLDANKQKVVGAIDGLNTLAASLRKQDGTIKQTLADLPSALRSVNSQRADLRKLLRALSKLSNVGVNVIKASKEATINSLSDLAPVLTAFADSGQALPKSLQVLLTYPFIDAAVGNSPQVARNLHIGDYTNLNISLDLDLNMLAQALSGGSGILPPTDLGTLVNLCQTSAPEQAQPVCDILNSLSSGLCALPGLGSTPLCVIPGVEDTATSNAQAASRNAKRSTSGASDTGVGTASADQNALSQVTSLLSNLFGSNLLGLGAGDSLGASGSTGEGTASGDPSAGTSPGATPTPGTLLGGLLSGLGLGRPAPAYDRAALTQATERLSSLAGVGTLLLQGVYS